MSITDTRPAITYDRARVTAIVDEHQQAADAQQLLVDRLRQLLRDEERQLVVKQARADQIREAWAAQGVTIPTQRTHGHDRPEDGAR